MIARTPQGRRCAARPLHHGKEITMENNALETENRIAELREETEALEKQLRSNSMKLDMARQRIRALEDTNQALQRAIIAQALAMDAITDVPPIKT